MFFKLKRFTQVIKEGEEIVERVGVEEFLFNPIHVSRIFPDKISKGSKIVFSDESIIYVVETVEYIFSKK